MKLGSVTNCWKEEDWIGGCLDLLDVDIRVVVISPQSYQGYKYDQDKSREIAEAKGAITMFVDTKSQEEMRNAALDYLRANGCEYALIVDADEWWTKDALKTIKAEVATGQYEAYRAKMRTMFRKPHWEAVSGEQVDDAGLIAMRTDKRVIERRHANTYEANLGNIGDIFHFSYAKRPEFIKDKIVNFSHAHEVIDGWYDNVFMPFTPDSHNFHPTAPPVWPSCREVKLPKEIEEKLIWKG